MYVYLYSYIYMHMYTGLCAVRHLCGGSGAVGAQPCICVHHFPYIGIYIYIYTYMHICLHTYSIHLPYIYACTHIYNVANTYICIYTYMSTYLYIYIYIFMYMHIHTYIHIHIYVCIYMYIYMYTYRYMHMSISFFFTAVCLFPRLPWFPASKSGLGPACALLILPASGRRAFGGTKNSPVPLIMNRASPLSGFRPRATGSFHAARKFEIVFPTPGTSNPKLQKLETDHRTPKVWRPEQQQLHDVLASTCQTPRPKGNGSKVLFRSKSCLHSKSCM